MKSSYSNHVLNWIYTLAIMVLMMVMIGGITRLTGSGLSIVEWEPLMGAIPPLNHDQWIEVFSKYQQSPQYQLVNRGMSLSEFQWIFFWEYIHRLIGRSLGVVFLIPLIFFKIKNAIDARWVVKLSFGFALGGLQGVMGWVMVASGLVSEPQVSHYRLAAHLILALLILIYFLRMAFEWKNQNKSVVQSLELNVIKKDLSIQRIHFYYNLLTGLIFLQIFYGALVAGLRAGFMMPTFPLMGGQIFPPGGFVFEPLWKNFFENPLTVQWTHRTIAWMILILSWTLFFKFKNAMTGGLKKVTILLFTTIQIQFIIGVLTLITGVSLPLAVAHQLIAFIVMGLSFLAKWQLPSLKL